MFKVGKFHKIISVILCISFLAGFYPGYMEAKPEPVDRSPQIVREEIDLRDEHSKVFKLDNNTYTAVSTADALHFKDENGEWQDIDNTLTEDKNGRKSNKSAGYKVTLPKDMGENEPVVIEKDGYTLSFNLITSVGKLSGKKESDKKVKEKREKLSDIAKKADFDKKSSTVIYNAFLNDTEIELVVNPTSLKENFILGKKPKKDFSLTYEINAEGLNGILCEDNSISFTDADENEVFSIPAPYMYDSSEDGKTSYDIDVTLQKDSGGTYKMVYIPSEEWLNAEETKYPVVIDPTVNTSTASSNITDTYITQGGTSTGHLANTNNAAKAVLYPAMPQNSDGEAFAFIKFNSLPSIQANAVITSAKLVLHDARADANGSEYGAGDSLAAIKLNRSWTDTLTWNAYQANGPSSYFTDTDTVDCADYKYENNANIFAPDVTKTVTEWYNGAANYGLALKAYMNTCNFAAIRSAEFSDAAQRPYMEISYTEVTGIDPRFEYHTMDMRSEERSCVH